MNSLFTLGLKKTRIKALKTDQILTKKIDFWSSHPAISKKIFDINIENNS